MNKGAVSKPFLLEASEILPILFKKSLDATLAINEALKKVQQANQASDDFLKEYFSSASTKVVNYINNQTDESLFVSVVTSLEKDGTFWCKYWTSSSPFKSDDIQLISNELGWKERELLIKAAKCHPLNTPLFTFSVKHNMYVRISIRKVTSIDQSGKDADKNVLVRFLDFGTIGELPTSSVFYYMPIDIEKKYPYKSMFCALAEDEQIDLPYEAKWRFRDLTSDKVLMAQVKEKINRCGLICNVIEMRSLIGEELSINQQVLEKVKQHVKNQEEAQKFNSNLKKTLKSTPEQQNIKTIDNFAFKKPIVPVNKRVLSNEQKSIESVTSTELTMKPTNTLSPQANQHQEQPEKASCSPSTPVRSASLSNLVENKHKVSRSHESLVRKVAVSRSHESLVQGYQSNKSNAHKASKRTKKDSYSDLRRLIDKKNKTKEAHPYERENGDKGMKVKKSKTTKKKKEKNFNRRDSERGADQRDNEKKAGSENPPEYWVDKIPQSQRVEVEKVLPPLYDMFYTATKWREEKWNEIELSNVQKILESQAVIKFYNYPVRRYRLKSSFIDGGVLEFSHILSEILQEDQSGCTHYIFLRPYIYGNRDYIGNSILGIARLDSTHASDKYPDHYPVTYFCLSQLRTQNQSWANQSSLPKCALRDAKDIILAYIEALEKNKTEPLFPHLYPWCSIPPMMVTTKPKGVKLTKRRPSEVTHTETKHSQPESECNDNNMSVCVSTESWDEELQESENILTNIQQEECSNKHLGDESVISFQRVSDKPQHEIETTPQDDEKVPFRPKKILQRFESLENDECPLVPSPTSSSTSPDDIAKYESRILELKRDITSGGFFDRSGTWYPTVAAAQVNTRPVRNDETNTSSDVNQNILSSTRASDTSAESNSSKEEHKCKQRTVHVLADGEDFERDSGCAIDFEKSVDKLLSSLTDLSNVGVDETRLEQDCLVFGLNKEDIDVIE